MPFVQQLLIRIGFDGGNVVFRAGLHWEILVTAAAGIPYVHSYK